MQTINIKKKLQDMGVDPDTVVMGDFDSIGRFTAERQRSADDPNYKKYGAFYRSNYERGILIYHLIRHHKMTSMLEIGFGRGYATFCAARAFSDAGVKGRIVTIDPNLKEDHLKLLQQIFPAQWFQQIEFIKGTSESALRPMKDQKFDLVYIDGDHSYGATKLDWELTRDKWEKCVLFDDYHLPTKQDPGIQCREAIDEIDWQKEGFVEPECVIMDRRMFLDDRQFADDKIDYGQALFTKAGLGGRNDW